ncbi:MAG: transketolase-like TK C-terminal-containing protein, partial [Cellulomonas sp.]
PIGSIRPDFLTADGGRVVRAVANPDVDLLATGSEVGLALGAADLLEAEGVRARVVSVPWRERHAAAASARDRAPITVSIEAGVTSGWSGLAAVRIGVDRFGASGKASDVLAHLGLTPAAVATRVAAAVRAETTDPGRR